MAFWSKPKIILLWKQMQGTQTVKENIELSDEETIAEVLARILLYVPPEGMMLWNATYKTSHSTRDVVVEGKWHEYQ